MRIQCPSSVKLLEVSSRGLTILSAFLQVSDVNVWNIFQEKLKFVSQHDKIDSVDCFMFLGTKIQDVRKHLMNNEGVALATPGLLIMPMICGISPTNRDGTHQWLTFHLSNTAMQWMMDHLPECFVTSSETTSFFYEVLSLQVLGEHNNE